MISTFCNKVVVLYIFHGVTNRNLSIRPYTQIDVWFLFLLIKTAHTIFCVNLIGICLINTKKMEYPFSQLYGLLDKLNAICINHIFIHNFLMFYRFQILILRTQTLSYLVFRWKCLKTKLILSNSIYSFKNIRIMTFILI